MRYFLLFCFSLCAVVNSCTDTTSDSDFAKPFCAKYSLNEHRKELSEKITDLAYHFKHCLTQQKGLNSLVEKLASTSTLDIGGIRRPLSAGIYSIADSNHITINRDQNSFPDFYCEHGLDFCGFLQQFPEVEGIISSRTTPLNCLISHVGDYIFEDAFQKKRTLMQFFKSAPVVMSQNCSIRFSALYGFIDGLSAYLCLLKGGTFTYKSFKHIFGTIDSEIFSTEATENYSCFWVDFNNAVYAHTFQQRILRFSTGDDDHITAHRTSGEEINLDSLWPLVGFSHRIFTDILGLSGVQTTMNALGEHTLFHTISFLVPGDYTKPADIDGRLTRLLKAYDAA